MDKLPEIGKTYNCFDDGKISESRLYTVRVKSVVLFKDADPDTMDLWLNRVKQCYWLFAESTDRFVFTEDGEQGDAVFARTVDGGWFSLGDFMNSGRLDVDGELTKTLTTK